MGMGPAFGFKDRLGQEDELGVPINPATEEKQDTIISALGGATAVGHGNGTVTTAGTPVQLSASSVPCRRVIVYSNSVNGSLTNGGIIVVGGATVVAVEATRKGASIYPANGLELKVSNLNLIYIDATDDGSKFHFYYEV